MAGLRNVEERGGLFSPLARAQCAALTELQWKIFVNTLRSKMGAFEFGARAVSYFFYCVLGLGLGVGAGAMTYALAASQKWQYLSLVFWFVFLLWQVVPIMLASFQEQFDLGSLLRFPVSFSSYYFLYVVFGLSDISTAIGGLCCAGIWVGVGIARPDLIVWAAVGLLLFAAFNVLLVRAIFAWIDRWLSQRRTREIVAALFMVFFLSFPLLNPAVWQHERRGGTTHRQERDEIRNFLEQPWVKTANAVQKELPPGLAGSAVREVAGQQSGQALGSLAFLILFTAGAGGALGWRLLSEYSGENLDSAPARMKGAVKAKSPTAARARAPIEEEWSSTESAAVMASPMTAIIEKEFRSLLRTLPLLYAVGAPLLMVLIVSGSFLRHGPRQHISDFAFPLCVFFSQLGMHQLFSNNLGAEGAGIQLYFLSPTPMRTVMLGKNLFHSLIYVATLVVAGFLAAIRLGRPPILMAAVTVAWLVFVLPCNLAAGNIFSLMMPYRINPGRLARQRRSQGSALLSLLVEVGTIAVGAAVYEACSVNGTLWMAIPICLILAAIAALVWLRILRNVDEIAAQRKDQLIAKLVKDSGQ